MAATPDWHAVALATKGFMPEDEGMALSRAARAGARSGLGPILEIGTYCAKSAIYLAAGAREGAQEGIGGRRLPLVFTVDHHRGSEELQPGWEHHDPDLVDAASGRTDTLPWARRALQRAGMEDEVVLVVGESSAVARWWRAPLSLLFIDGAHSPELAWADYRSWAPHVAPGGLLAVHDVFADPAQGGQGPYEVVRAALASEEFVPSSRCGPLCTLRRVR